MLELVRVALMLLVACASSPMTLRTETISENGLRDAADLPVRTPPRTIEVLGFELDGEIDAEISQAVTEASQLARETTDAHVAFSLGDSRSNLLDERIMVACHTLDARCLSWGASRRRAEILLVGVVHGWTKNVDLELMTYTAEGSRIERWARIVPRDELAAATREGTQHLLDRLVHR